MVVGGGGAAVGLSAVTAFGLGWRPHLVDPGTRAAIETGITIAALAAAGLLLIQYRRRRQMYPLLLLSAVIAVALTDFVFSALPPLIGGGQVPLDPDAAVVSQALVPLTFAAAAFAGDRTTADRRFWPALPIGCGCVAIFGVSELVELIVGRSSAGAPSSAPVLSAEVAAAAAFVFAGVAFVRRGRASSSGACLMGAASFLLAAGRLQAIAIPVVAADWVTPRELLRLAAYSLVLGAVCRDHVRLNRASEEAALAAQRERIARDLHDGLAQDLAVIAFHGQRLEAELGANHPVTVAARHALAASRQAIVDLSASHAPSTSAALREVANELEARFGIVVTVHDEVQTTGGVEPDLGSRPREQFVRIAREAIVNAARHGDARHVDVTIATRGERWLLTIADDGSGIPESQLVSPSGFGLRTMRARADELGGQFSAGPGAAGGTVLELSMAGSAEAGTADPPRQL